MIEHKHMLEETEQESRWMVEVNVLGTIFIATHAARAMVAAGTRGTIVNVSSGNQAGHSYHATYGATKGAVSTLTYAWARDLDEHGITVNAISPNAPTGQVQKLIATFGRNTEHAVLPEPEDNAAVVVFLLSDRARHLNGQIVRLEHGRLNVMGHPVAVHPRVEMAFLDGRRRRARVRRHAEREPAAARAVRGAHRARRDDPLTRSATAGRPRG